MDLTINKKTVPVVTLQHFSRHDRNKININYVISGEGNDDK